MAAFTKRLIKSISLGIVAGSCFFAGWYADREKHQESLVALEHKLEEMHQKELVTTRNDLKLSFIDEYNSVLKTIVVTCSTDNQIFIGDKLFFCIEASKIVPNSSKQSVDHDDDVYVL